MISNAHKALIHVAKSHLNMDDKTYRVFLHATAGVESSKELTPATFKMVMDGFYELGFMPKNPRKWDYDHRKYKTAGGAAWAQIALMKHEWCRVTGHPMDSGDMKATLFVFLIRTVMKGGDYEDWVDMQNRIDGKSASIAIRIIKNMKTKKAV